MLTVRVEAKVAVIHNSVVRSVEPIKRYFPLSDIGALTNVQPCKGGVGVTGVTM